MDDRVFGLLTDFPVIFEKKAISDVENGWVIIDVSDNETGTEELISADDAFLSDLDRYNEPDELEDKAVPYVVDDLVAPPDILPPPDIDLDRGGRIEIILRRRPTTIDKLRRKITGSFPGGPGGWGRTLGLVPPPDALAVYLPFHRYPDMWGIYLLDSGVASLATDLQRLIRLRGRSLIIHDARRAAVTYLFHHAGYHSAMEAFGLRCELPLRKPVYRTGLRKLYTRAHGYPANHTRRLWRPPTGSARSALIFASQRLTWMLLWLRSALHDALPAAVSSRGELSGR